MVASEIYFHKHTQKNLLPIGDRSPLLHHGEPGDVSVTLLEKEALEFIPQNVDFAPYSRFSVCVINFNEILAKLDLYDSSKIPTNLSTLG